ncbi:hypothetical protein F5884DRAFT_758053 [Xylogone sp. PMI_703]|nr:hypothetical protein F5884DRAFT_758053 [Xylogone sp. PMI_703]
MAQDRVMTIEERCILFHQQEEQRHRDRQARDEAGMQALLRHKESVEAKKVQEAEECKLATLKEREQKQALRDQQDEQRRRARQARDEAIMEGMLRQKAIVEAKRAQGAEN